MSAPQSESSLPTQAVDYLASSPPILYNPRPNTSSMENKPNETSDSRTQEGSDNDRPTAALVREGSGDTERAPPSNQQTPIVEKSNPNEQVVKEEEEESYDEEQDLADPNEPLKPFNWNDLEAEYHAAMKKCDDEESALMEEWVELTKIWAQSGHHQETDRTFRRLKTRMAHVQHSEEDIEKTRQHYVSVVQAFERAIYLSYQQSSTKAPTHQTTTIERIARYMARTQTPSSSPPPTPNAHFSMCNIM